MNNRYALYEEFVWAYKRIFSSHFISVLFTMSRACFNLASERSLWFINKGCFPKNYLLYNYKELWKMTSQCLWWYCSMLPDGMRTDENICGVLASHLIRQLLYICFSLNHANTFCNFILSFIVVVGMRCKLL